MASLCSSSSSPPPPRQGWVLFHQLLIDLFKFLAPFLRNAELTKPTQLLYKVRHCPLSTLSPHTSHTHSSSPILPSYRHASPHRILLSTFSSTHTPLSPFRARYECYLCCFTTSQSFSVTTIFRSAMSSLRTASRCETSFSVPSHVT